MSPDKSFRQRMEAGATREDLMRYYALTPGQFDNIINCLKKHQTTKNEPS
jgi:hypothetical protein